MRVLVTGGTGVLGRELVRRLDGQAEVEVRVLTRRRNGQPGSVRGDLETGEGLATALAGVDVVAHCASAADYVRPRRDVEQARRLLAAAQAAGVRPHLVYISIVGVDRIPFGYYRAKLAAERLVQDSGLPWTILRTTQFHDLALMFLALAASSPVVVLPRGIAGQPVDTGEVADRMAELVLAGPAGRVADLGGPLVEEPAAMARSYLALTGRRRLLLPVPVPGRVAAGFRAGHHLVGEDGEHGTRTFEDYLRSRIGPDGSVGQPYDLRRRFRRH